MDRGQNELQPYTSFSNTILLFKHYILSHLHEQQILNKLCYNENGENTHFTYENIDSLHRNQLHVLFVSIFVTILIFFCLILISSSNV